MRTRSRFLLPLACLLLLLAPTLTAGRTGYEPPGKTLAPYFFVEGDPSVDRLPLKFTDVDVHIAGVIADVKVVQTYKNEGSRPIEARYVFPGPRAPRSTPCRCAWATG